MAIEWWYIKDGTTFGPVTQRAMVGMFSDGTLKGSEWVWNPSLPAWTRSYQFKVFEIFPPRPATQDQEPSTASEIPLPDPKGWRTAGPWSRLLAQGIDQYLTALIGGFLGGLVIAMAGISMGTGWGDKVDELLLGLAFIPISLLLQAILLSTVGTTPGKALLRLHLRHADGRRPSLTELINRQGRLWVMGYALGMPLFSLFTFFLSYTRVGRGQPTAWDLPLGLVVRQPGPQRGRVWAGLIVYVLLCSAIPVITLLTEHWIPQQEEEARQEPAPPNPAQSWENPVTHRAATVEAGWDMEQEKLDSGGTVHWFWSQTDSGAAMIQRDFITGPFTIFARHYLDEQVKEAVTRPPTEPVDGKPACAEGTTPGDAETEPGTTYIIRVCGLTSGEVWYLRGRTSNDDEAAQTRVRTLLDQLEGTLH